MVDPGVAPFTSFGGAATVSVATEGAAGVDDAATGAAATGVTAGGTAAEAAAGRDANDKGAAAASVDPFQTLIVRNVRSGRLEGFPVSNT